MPLWVVEVQHSTDMVQDGKWFELERTTDGNYAVELWQYFFVVNPKVTQHLTGSYAGRPGRIRIAS